MISDPDVLIVSAPDDVHSRAVRREVEAKGASCAILGNGDFPARATMTYAWNGEGEQRRLGCLELTGAKGPAVWLRRSQTFTIDEGMPGEYRSFAGRTTEATFESLVCGSSPLVVNPPHRNGLVDHKPFQLQLARACGLPIPRTVITNDPAQAHAFAAAHPRCITKAMVSWRYRLIETRPIDQDAPPDFDAVRLCPILLQEFLDGTTEYRVTIVGSRVFTAEIDLSSTPLAIDARVHPGRILTAGALPHDVEVALLRFHRAAGLLYGAYDLRCDAEGLPHFLEVNPGGQFLFAEIAAGLPISAAMADLLVDGSNRPRSSKEHAA